MREPLFTEKMQVGIVVRDLDATLRMYVEDYGIGPWDVYEFNPGNAKNLRERPRSLMFRPGTPAHRHTGGRGAAPAVGLMAPGGGTESGTPRAAPPVQLLSAWTAASRC